MKQEISDMDIVPVSLVESNSMRQKQSLRSNIIEVPDCSGKSPCGCTGPRRQLPETGRMKDALCSYAKAFCDNSQDSWELIDEIGSGNSASVYKLISDDRTAALKIYEPRFFEGDKSVVEKRRVLDQMSLKGHGHPNLIDFFDAGEIDSTYFLLMEYLPWKSLDRRIKTIERTEIAGIISKIAAAAEYLEGRNFVHRDIKPENILISDDDQKVKLLDLGVIRPISTESSGGTDHGYALPFVATAQYSSPAYLFRDGEPTEDMWKALTFYQLGAVLHDLLMKYPLFMNEVRTQNRYRVAAAVLLTVPEVHASDTPPWLVALARNCLVKVDDLRLNRVDWSSFHADRRSNIDEQRRRLGLQQSGSATHRDSEERIRVRLDSGRDFLLEICRHIRQRENFPQTRIDDEGSSITSNSRMINFIFSPRHAVKSSTKLHFILRLSVQSEYNDQVDIHFSAFLTKDGEIPDEYDDERLLWSTLLANLNQENDQLVSLFTDEFIFHYAAADDQLNVFEKGKDSVLAITREI